MTRHAELKQSLHRLETRIARAATAAGRPRADVTLVAVTKFFPLQDVELLASLGVQDFGESREQELHAKSQPTGGRPDVRWHFLGRIQTNKAKGVASSASVIHSFDRVELIGPITKGVAARMDGVSPVVLIQVSLDGDTARGGARPADVPTLADAVATAGLHVGGVMAIAPVDAEPTAAFTRLEQLSVQLRREHPLATVISAGMSGDLEAAIACGATLVRVGTALLGGRPPIGH